VSIGGTLRFLFKRAFGGTQMLKVGDEAPDFEVMAHLGRTVRLRDLRGRKVVLWFFPKADTPG